MTTSAAWALRTRIERGGLLVVPGAANALTARLVEEAGFEAVYLTGAGIANTYLGVPDVGLVTLSEVAAHTAALHGAVEIPIIVDADTGFGSAVNVWHTVRTLERAGASAIQLEDQTFPKRCGHFADKTVISSEEMTQKIAAACDARVDADTIIIARTDALAQFGVEDACDRGNAYRSAGADMVFVEGPTTEQEIEAIANKVDAPLLLNLVEGGRTPILPHRRVDELGFSVALHANLALLATIHATTETLAHLRADGAGQDRPLTATWEERQRVVRKPWFDALGDRYFHGDEDADRPGAKPPGSDR